MVEKEIKDEENIFKLNKLEKETNNVGIKGIGNLFKRKKEKKAIKDITIRDIWGLFVYEEEDYYRVGNVWSNNYIECKSKGDRKTLSAEEYLKKLRPYLENILNNLKKLIRGKSN